MLLQTSVQGKHYTHVILPMHPFPSTPKLLHDHFYPSLGSPPTAALGLSMLSFGPYLSGSRHVCTIPVPSPCQPASSAGQEVSLSHTDCCLISLCTSTTEEAPCIGCSKQGPRNMASCKTLPAAVLLLATDLPTEEMEPRQMAS